MATLVTYDFLRGYVEIQLDTDIEIKVARELYPYQRRGGNSLIFSDKDQAHQALAKISESLIKFSQRE